MRLGGFPATSTTITRGFLLIQKGRGFSWKHVTMINPSPTEGYILPIRMVDLRSTPGPSGFNRNFNEAASVKIPPILKIGKKSWWWLESWVRVGRSKVDSKITNVCFLMSEILGFLGWSKVDTFKVPWIIVQNHTTMETMKVFGFNPLKHGWTKNHPKVSKNDELSKSPCFYFMFSPLTQHQLLKATKPHAAQ